MAETLEIRSLFDPQPPVNLTLEQKFQVFHAANPLVYEALRKLALDLVERGQTRFGISMIYEVVRWRHFMRTNDDTGWKLNNSYRSRYARLLAANEPQLANVFETRVLTSTSPQTP